jgi:hypothetical protein
MMVYETYVARCPRCNYSATIRKDAISLYQGQCPACYYPKDEQGRSYTARPVGEEYIEVKPKRRRKTKAELEGEEWLMDISGKEGSNGNA